jgi:hypothetical protein
MKLKDSDLVAATHGRSFWILDDVTAMRGLADGRKSTRLFAPRTAIRTKLHWSAGANVRTGIAYGPAFGIDGSTVMVERADGTRYREHLDVGENPPNGAIVYYWLATDAAGPLTLTFRDSAGRKIMDYTSNDETLPPARRPGTKAGLNRYVWDMKYPGPTKLDYGLAPPRPKPLVPDPENPPGPTVVPGSYGVELTLGEKGKSKSYAAKFSVVKDAAADHAGRVRRAIRPAQGPDRVGVEAEAGGQSPAQDEASARGSDRTSRQGRARLEESRRGDRPQALGHRERDG